MSGNGSERYHSGDIVLSVRFLDVLHTVYIDHDGGQDRWDKNRPTSFSFHLFINLKVRDAPS